MQIENRVLIDIVGRMLQNAYQARSYVEDGKEIYCERRVSALIDQLTKLHSVLSEPDVQEDQKDQSDSSTRS
jgi:hypothetical protein